MMKNMDTDVQTIYQNKIGVHNENYRKRNIYDNRNVSKLLQFLKNRWRSESIDNTRNDRVI